MRYKWCSEVRSTGDPNTEQSQFRLSDPEDVLASLIRLVGDAVSVVDLDGRIVRWNAACEELYGWPHHEVIGEKLPNIPRARRLAIIRDIRAIVASGRVTETDLDCVCADGNHIGVHCVVIPVKDADGDAAGVIFIAHDVTRDQRDEHNRQDFSTLVSRNLIEPLSLLAGNARLLLRREIFEDADRRAASAIALAESAERALRFAGDLMVYSALTDAELELVCRPFDLPAVVSRAMQGPGSERVLVDFESDLPAVDGDADRIEAALAALVAHVVGITPADRSATVSVTAEGEWVAIEVVAGTTGTNPADRSAALPRREDPTIAHVRGVAEAHGGTMATNADESGMLRFVVRLPVAHDEK